MSITTPAAELQRNLLNIEMVRKRRREDGVVPLALTSASRRRWQLAGLTFQQRDNAATYLVRNGEAAYRDLRCLGRNATTAHIVALQNLEEVERLVAEHRWAGVSE